MPTCASTVRSLPRELTIGDGEQIDALMERVDREEVRQVCRHLLGDLELARAGSGAAGTGGAR